MPDPKSFLKIPRRDWPERPVRERVHDWNEVHAERSLLPIIGEQAGRCMDCGIPFCHQGCPLGNLIPEWNDLVWRDDWRAASERLHATNNFPEFTGRLCPAPCEAACVLAINTDPVTIKNVEVAIADQAWEQSFVQPVAPERLSGRTVAVVGSGPAGLAVAQQLTRAGHTVAVYERADRAGGLLRYGIPEFKMEKRHLDRRLDQMRAEGTIFRTGVDVGVEVNAADLRDRYDAVVLAIGATAARELPVPGRELDGVHQAMDYLTAANRVQEGTTAAPAITAEGKHVAVIGGGDTGTDCVGTAVRQGAASVTHVDINPEPTEARPHEQPWPTYPRVYRVSVSHDEVHELELGVPESGRAGADGRIYAAATLELSAGADGGVGAVHLTAVEPDSRAPMPRTERTIPAQLVLLALGFTGPEPGGPARDLGLPTSGGPLGRGPDFGTDVDGVFVAGDAGRGPSLIVWAIAEGRAAAAGVDRYLGGSAHLPAPVRPDDRPLAV